MNVHHYDQDTGRFLGTSEAKPDPLELELARRAVYEAGAQAAQAAFDEDGDEAALQAGLAGAEADAAAVEPTIWLLPAGSTFTAPPATAEGEAAFFTETDWEVRPDPELAPPTAS